MTEEQTYEYFIVITPSDLTIESIGVQSVHIQTNSNGDILRNMD